MSDDSSARGKSQHAFMAEALGVQSRLVEQRRDFLRAAFAAEDDALATGEAYDALDIDVYFDALALEQPPSLPRLCRWRA
jgi:hypothetical protein